MALTIDCDLHSIYEAIGRGKHSVVYKGRKKKTIQYYAIKSVEKTQKSRVLQEVRDRCRGRSLCSTVPLVVGCLSSTPL